MVTKERYADLSSFLLFAMMILVPSLDTVAKYSGMTGIVVYLIAGLVILALIVKYLLPLYFLKVSENLALAIALFTVTSAGILVFFFLYPLADSGRVGGGTDVDNAMIIGVTELLNGKYPYYVKTYLGLPVSPMPGIFLLAAPFVLLNAIALQNFVWLILLFVAARKYLGGNRTALLLIAVIIFLSPTALQNLVTGSDYLSNAIYVLIAMWLIIRKIPDPTVPAWQKILLSIFFGLTLSSRSNFMLCVPILFSSLVQHAGWRSAVKYLTISGLAFIAITLPFWLYDPSGFTPLTAQTTKLRIMNELLPYSGIAVPICSYLLTIALAFQRMDGDGRVLFRNCAIAQFFLFFSTAILFSIATGKIDLGLGSAGYGMFTLFFAAIAGWMTLTNRGKRNTAAYI